MIDQFTILTKGGIALWSIEWAKLKGQPINNLLTKVLIQDRSADNSYQHDLYTLKWTFSNDVDLIFVVVYQKILTLMYIDELLNIIKKKFVKMFKDELVAIKNNQDLIEINMFESFEQKFNQVLTKVENQQRQKSSQSSGPRKFEDTERGKLALEQKRETELLQIQKGTLKKEDAIYLNNNNNNNKNGVKSPKNKNAVNKDDTPKKQPKKGKELTTWDDKISKKDAAALNRSETEPTAQKDKKVEKVDFKLQNLDLDDDLSSDDDDQDEDKPVSGFMKYFQVLTGNRVIGKDDLAPVLEKFITHLTNKNVALDIAEKLVESIGGSLEGKKLSTFQGVNTVVKQAMEESLLRILTPKKQIDILRDIQACKGRPYTMAFTGVNGVGKSTNLAKVCYWLKSHGKTVMLAACDTFRSGAIEQLKTHADRLDVELFERGYGKDAAAIAGSAIEYARSKSIDVVLIDTAGRMQNNEPFMRALSKLVNQNSIDLVLFVGEALVGNIGVEQLTKFDKSLSLVQDSTSNDTRTIDGIILTKFDTIDDKVGAAISMVYATGHPILFLGTGQNYTDLKKMNIKSVVKSLLN